MYVYVYIYMYTYICTYIYVSVRMLVCVFVCVPMKGTDRQIQFVYPIFCGSPQLPRSLGYSFKKTARSAISHSSR